MKIKLIGIIIVVIMCVGLFAIFGVQSIKNDAISREEQIEEAVSNIKVQEKRRADLLPNLVDTVKAYDRHEYQTLMDVISARSESSDDKADTIQTAIRAVAEAYPDLKSNSNYQNLMNELATTENLIANHRKSYNSQVKSYNRFCRQFPNRLILQWLGYQPIDLTYLQYETSSDAPTNLFGD